jgi:tellurite resistance protein
MANIFRAARGAMYVKLERHRNRPFLEAMMAAAALLALADSEVKLSERLALDFILDNVKELKMFDVHKAVNLFRDYGQAIEKDFNTGKAKVFQAVAKFAGDEDKGSLLIRACILIAKADGDFSEPEQKVVDELCRLLSLDSSEVCRIEPEEEENI